MVPGGRQSMLDAEGAAHLGGGIGRRAASIRSRARSLQKVDRREPGSRWRAGNYARSRLLRRLARKACVPLLLAWVEMVRALIAHFCVQHVKHCGEQGGRQEWLLDE